MEHFLHYNILLLINHGSLKKGKTFLFLWLAPLIIIKESKLCFMVPKPSGQSSQLASRTTINHTIYHHINKTELFEIFTSKSVILTLYGHHPSQHLNSNLKSLIGTMFADYLIYAGIFFIEQMALHQYHLRN